MLGDVDVGSGRTVVTGPGPALDIAARVESAPSLRFEEDQG
jgi:hypothetical protein